MFSLFSIFDPMNSNNMSLNWLMIFLIFFILPNSFWLIYSRFEMLFNKFNLWIFNEFKSILKKKYLLILYISFMMMILIINFISLFPYIFTSTSHLNFSLTFSLPLWVMLMMFGWINYQENMFAHMLPMGTPKILMSFMILIETISNVIRPLTLSIRLTANMIAGHLLLSLMGSTGNNLMLILLIIMLSAQILLMILEMSVSVIQSYVYSVLGTLYTTEI